MQSHEHRQTDVLSVQSDAIVDSIKCPFYPQGAPESVMERCQYLRVGTEKVTLTPGLRDQLMSKIREWGTGRDTLRCLALATHDTPPFKEDMDMEDSSKFVQYEVQHHLMFN